MSDSCQIIEPLLAAYALDALDVEDKGQVEAHIDSCPTCQLILADYRYISDGLMTALPPKQPPARIRAQLLTQTAPKDQETSWFERWQKLRPRLLQIATITAILVLLIFNISLLISTNQILEQQEILTQQNRAYQTAFALLTYPNSNVAVIDNGNIYGTLVYDPYGQLAVLNVWGLEDLPPGQEYQIWLIEPDQTRISGGLFRPSDQNEYVSIVIESPDPIKGYVGFGVTIEPEGGSPGPTGPRVFGLEL